MNEQCKNTAGSFKCTCLQGYSRDGADCLGMNNHSIISVWLQSSRRFEEQKKIQCCSHVLVVLTVIYKCVSKDDMNRIDTKKKKLER